MSALDRFVCRREGHKPSITITATEGFRIESYVCTCLRCGKAFKVVPREYETGTSGKPA